MDVLLTANINSPQTTVLIFWGNNQTLGTIKYKQRLTIHISIKMLITFWYNKSIYKCMCSFFFILSLKLVVLFL